MLEAMMSAAGRVKRKRKKIEKKEQNLQPTPFFEIRKHKTVTAERYFRCAAIVGRWIWTVDDHLNVCRVPLDAKLGTHEKVTFDRAKLSDTLQKIDRDARPQIFVSSDEKQVICYSGACQHLFVLSSSPPFDVLRVWKGQYYLPRNPDKLFSNRIHGLFFWKQEMFVMGLQDISVYDAETFEFKRNLNGYSAYCGVGTKYGAWVVSGTPAYLTMLDMDTGEILIQNHLPYDTNDGVRSLHCKGEFMFVRDGGVRYPSKVNVYNARNGSWLQRFQLDLHKPQMCCSSLHDEIVYYGHSNMQLNISKIRQPQAVHFLAALLPRTGAHSFLLRLSRRIAILERQVLRSILRLAGVALKIY